MKRNLYQLVAIGILSLSILLPPNAIAAPLTQQQIVDLHSAGIGDATIARQVDANGISFNADATSLVDLKKAGLSDAVLDAVIRSSRASARPVAPAMASDAVGDLYKAKRYSEAGDLILATIQAGKANERDYTILILTLLKLDKLEGAEAQYTGLLQRFSQSTYIAPLGKLLVQARQRQELKQRVDQALKNLDGQAVQAEIQKAALDPFERRLLMIDAAVLRGDFTVATQLSTSGDGLSLKEGEQLKSRAKYLTEQRLTYESSMAVWGIACYGDGSLAKSIDEGDLRPLVDSLRKQNDIAPLAPTVLDHRFFIAVFLGSPEEVQSFGDQLQRINHRITLAAEDDRMSLGFLGMGTPNFGRIEFDLVIDSQSQRLFTDHVRYAGCAPKCASTTPHGFVSFDIPFNDIQGVSQQVEFDGWGINSKSDMLIVKPTGVVPFLHCATVIYRKQGLRAITNAAYNLGSFIQHVARLDPKHVVLVDRNASERGSGSIGVMNGLAVAATAVGAPNASQLTDAAATLSEHEAAHSQEAAAADANWLELKADRYFNFSIADSVMAQEIENALSLTRP